MIEAKTLPIEQLHLSSARERRSLDEPNPDALRMAEDTGILEPVVVRSIGHPGLPSYEILSGCQSWAIAQRLMFPTIPAVVLLGLSDQEAALYVKVHENVVRYRRGGGLPNDDDPLQWAEFARAFLKEKRLRQPAYTQKDLAAELRIDCTTLSHGFRLLDRLHPAAREALRRGRVTISHTKALAGIPYKEQPRVLDRIILRGASVRDIEKAARSRRSGQTTRLTEEIYRRPADYTRVERVIRDAMGVPVRLAFDSETGRGTLTLEFATLDIFDGILERLGLSEISDR